MKSKLPLFSIPLLVLAVVALASVGWWWHLSHVRKVVWEAMPPVPAVEDSQSELRVALTLALERAGTLRESRQGLGDLARIYHANGFVDEALQCYEALEVLQPEEPSWPHFRAVILAGYGDVDTAMALWRRVIKLAPDYLPARLRLADSALKANDLKEAEAIYQGVLEQQPDGAYALLGLARIDFELERWQSARQRLEQLVTQTDYKLGYDLIVSVYERLGMQSEAAAVRAQTSASGAFREAPDPWLDALVHACFDPYRIAIAAGVVGDPEVAEKLLRRAIRLDPEDVAYRLQLVSLYAEQGDTAAALHEVQKMTRRAPTFADGWMRLSALYRDMGNQDAAVQAILTGLEHCPDSPGLHLRWGQILRKSGRQQEAARALRTSITLRSNESPAYIELGQTLVEMGNVDGGIEQFRRSLEVEPGNPAALAFLAFHAISTGNRAEADEWMAHVDRQPRVGKQPAEHLARAYEQAFGQPWLRTQ